MSSRAVVFSLLLLLSYGSCRLGAQATALTADLPKTLSGDTLTTGSTFMLKVTSPWKEDRCALSAGALLHATVRHSERNAKGRIASVSFEVSIPCSEGQPVPVVVTSLLAPTDVESLSQQQFHGSSFGESTAFGKTGIQGGDEPDMSGRQNAALPFSNGPMDRSNRPSAVHVGEVYRLARIRLAVPAPGAVESTISTTGAGLTLPARTTFVLQSTRMGPAVLAVATKSAGSPLPAQAIRHALVHACVAGQCTQSSAVHPRSVFGVRLLGTAHDLAPFGFRLEGDREFRELDSGTAIEFVGNDEVAVSFPSRQLVKRLSGRPAEVHARSLRTVVIDASSDTLHAIQNWQVQDNNASLWSLGNEVLVHDEDTLRLLDSGLQATSSLPLHGPLSTLRISPDGRHVLVGEVHELHSAEEHGMLVQADARGAEEEVRWSVLDAQLHHVKTLGVSSTYRLPPVLLNEGLVELRKEGTDKYNLVRQSWDTYQEVRLGSFDSTCIPSFESTAPDLLLLTTCDAKDLGAHSIFLHPDGTPVLDETLAWHDMPLQSISGSQGQRVAFTVVHGKEDYTRGHNFRLGSIASETAEVVDAQHGVTLAVVPLPAVSPYKRVVALSPDGCRLAILSGTKLSVYDILPPS